MSIDARLIGLRIERHRDAVHAVALAGGLRAVREHVTEMPAAFRAMHLGASHAVAAVGLRVHGVRERRPETRPAGPALEFRFGVEQGLATTRTAERARPLFLVQRAAPAHL